MIRSKSNNIRRLVLPRLLPDLSFEEAKKLDHKSFMRYDRTTEETQLREIIYILLKLPGLELTQEVIEMLRRTKNTSDKLSRIIKTLPRTGSEKRHYESAMIELLSQELEDLKKSNDSLNKEKENLIKEKRDLLHMMNAMNSEKKLDSNLSRYIESISERPTKRVRRRVSPSKTKYDLFKGFFDKESYEEGFSALKNRICEFLNAEDLLIFKLEDGFFKTTFKGSPRSIDANKTILSTVINQKQIKSLTYEDTEFDTLIESSLQYPIKSFHACPLSLDRSKSSEVLFIMKLVPSLSSDEDISMVSQLFSSFKNYWNWRNRATKQRQLTTDLIQTVERILSEQSSNNALLYIKEEAKRIFEVERTYLWYPSPNKRALQKVPHATNTESVSLTRGITGACVVNEEMISSTAFDKKFDQDVDDPLGRNNTREVISCPIFTKQSLAAVLVCVNKETKNKFSAFDKFLVTSFCRVVGLALESLMVKENFANMKERVKKVKSAVKILARNNS